MSVPKVNRNEIIRFNFLHFITLADAVTSIVTGAGVFLIRLL